MRREAGYRGPHLDGLGGVRPAQEVEPVAESRAVVDEPYRRGGHDQDACQPEGAGAQSAAAGQREADASPGQQRHHPAVITGVNGSHQRGGDRPKQARGAPRIAVQASAPLDQPDGDPDRLAEKERLGHGRGLQVEQVGIGGEKSQRQSGRGRRKPVARQPVEARAGGEICQRRGNRSGNPVGPPTVDLNKGNHQQVR
jgi:hypothetical protein